MSKHFLLINMLHLFLPLMPTPDLLKDGMIVMLDCSLPLPMVMSQLIHEQLTLVVILLLSPMRSVMMVLQMPTSLMLVVLIAKHLAVEMELLTLVKNVMVNNFALKFAQLLFWVI